MDTLRVRVYNVRFGDAFLISVPEKGKDKQVTTRHILVDVGNAYSGDGGLDTLFPPVVKDILNEVGEEGIDLYIMTHEHMDHVQGLLYANNSTKFQEQNLQKKLGVKHAWLTGSSDPGYYASHPKAKEKKLQAEATYNAIKGMLAASDTPVPGPVQALMMNNNSRSTDDCVEFLRGLAPVGNTWYIHRGTDLTGKHNFEEASFEIWAPEEDTSDYYGSFQPLAFSAVPGSGIKSPASSGTALPPPGVDAGAFYNLVDHRKRGWADNLLAIDRAANNTSIVFCLNWRGWKLLFTGDAEQRSWKTMQRENMPKAVNFLKVGHHGSRNATPALEILKQILPEEPGMKQFAVVSTYDDTYSNVPDDEWALEEIKHRCKLWDTRKLADGEYFDIPFKG